MDRRWRIKKITEVAADWATWSRMIQLAIALPLGCILGGALGDWGDHHWHQSWMAVTGIVLGAIGGFIQIFRTAQKYLKRGE
jgi:ATP synthase protein I